MCEGIGEEPCAFCKGTGEIEITSCPKGLLSRDVIEFLPLADDAEKGSLPLAGGVLNQTSSFNAARRCLRAEDGHWRLVKSQRS